MATFEHMGITSGCLRCHKAGGGAQSAPIDDIHRQAPGADCSECHRSTDSFASGALLDHSGFSSGCATAGCHARDKGRARSHTALAECQSCHSYPSWTNVRMNHSSINSTQCKACHVRGGNAMASPSDQFHASVATQDCSACHSTATFAGATIDHGLITTGCGSSSCHAADRTRAPNHAGLSSCESCHSYPSWPSVTMNHNAIGTTQCKACHRVAGTASAPPADQRHASIGSLDCSACHSTVTFVGGGVDHSVISTGCGSAGCHATDRTRAPNHTGLSSCESCHRYPSWLSVTMNHSAIGTTLCKSCHTAGGIATASPSDQIHANIGSQDCSACHSTATFAGARVDHSTITTGCGASGCHAADRTRAPVHAALISCESCHRYPSWPSVSMNHNAIGATRCDSCHLYGSNAGLGRGAPNDSRHRNAQSGGRDCSSCHNTRNFD
jgi:hypothetical protein